MTKEEIEKQKHYLSGANLREANLNGADLSGADLREALGIKYVQISWSGHGEAGRQLSAVVINAEPRYFCGCWQGTIEELREFIASGEDQYKASRTIAADFCETRIKEMMTDE